MKQTTLGESKGERFCRLNGHLTKIFKLQSFIRICSKEKPPLLVYCWRITEVFLFMSTFLFLPRNMVREPRGSNTSPEDNNSSKSLTLLFRKNISFGITNLFKRIALVHPSAWCKGEIQPESQSPKHGIGCILSLICLLFHGGKHDSILKVFQKFTPSVDGLNTIFFNNAVYLGTFLPWGCGCQGLI